MRRVVRRSDCVTHMKRMVRFQKRKPFGVSYLNPYSTKKPPGSTIFLIWGKVSKKKEKRSGAQVVHF